MSGDLYLDGLVPKAKVRSCCCSFVTIDEEPNPHILPQKVHWIYWVFCKRFDRLHYLLPLYLAVGRASVHPIRVLMCSALTAAPTPPKADTQVTGF